jgi:hypothetical protein
MSNLKTFSLSMMAYLFFFSKGHNSVEEKDRAGREELNTLFSRTGFDAPYSFCI